MVFKPDSTEISGWIASLLGTMINTPDVGLGVVGYFPQLVNYLPLRSYYSSEVSPPPINPKLQECLIAVSYTHLTLPTNREV